MTMLEFELPWFDASTIISEPIFQTLIDRDISGIVVRTENEFRLVHYSQLQGALAQGIRSVGGINGYTSIISGTVPGTRLFVPGEFHLKGLGAGMAALYSGSERGARMYLSGNPG